MKSTENTLIISHESGCADVVKEVIEKSNGSSAVHQVSTPANGLKVLNRLGLSRGKFPLIFLHVSKSNFTTQGFLELLDRDYCDEARNSVVLINDDLDLSELVKLAVHDSVFHFVNCPVLSIEVENIISLKSRPVVA